MFFLLIAYSLSILGTYRAACSALLFQSTFEEKYCLFMIMKSLLLFDQQILGTSILVAWRRVDRYFKTTRISLLKIYIRFSIDFD